MSGAQTLADLDVLAGRLRDTATPLDQQVEALVALDQGLSRLPGGLAPDVDAAESGRILERARRISGLTQLGELPQLAALDGLADTGIVRHLQALCAQPMSADIVTDFVATLESTARNAHDASKQMNVMQEQMKRDRLYRDLLQDLSELMMLLLDDGGLGPAAPH